MTLAELKFRNDELLLQALTHKSFSNENKDKIKSSLHNERLEFLGDAVLDLVLSDYLMSEFPELNEGDLSKIRAGLVNESVLSQVALELELHNQLKLGKGELQTGGLKKPRLLASVFEAVIGAYYLDSGFIATKHFVTETFRARVQDTNPLIKNGTDFKTQLQEVMQERFKRTPTYVVARSDGPDHDKTFFVCVYLDKKKLAEGFGKSKKQAEQVAAQAALKEI